MKKCMNCGAELPEEASFCPYCTATQDEKHRVVPRWPRTRWMWIAICVVAAAVILCLCLWLFHDKKPESEPPVTTEQTVQPTAESPSPAPETTQKPAQESTQEPSSVLDTSDDIGFPLDTPVDIREELQPRANDVSNQEFFVHLEPKEDGIYIFNIESTPLAGANPMPGGIDLLDNPMVEASGMYGNTEVYEFIFARCFKLEAGQTYDFCIWLPASEIDMNQPVTATVTLGWDFVDDVIYDPNLMVDNAYHASVNIKLGKFMAMADSLELDEDYDHTVVSAIWNPQQKNDLLITGLSAGVASLDIHATFMGETKTVTFTISVLNGNSPGASLGAETVYTDSDGEYQLFLCFDNNGLSPPQESRELSLPKDANGGIPSILVVNKDGSRARDEFLKKVERYTVKAVPLASYKTMELSAPRVEYKMPSATLMCDVSLAADCGTNQIIWTLEMKDGSVLTLGQTVTVSLSKSMDIYPEDEPMGTVKELQSLLDRLDRVAGADTIVTIYLPSVTYQGDLQISSHAVNLFGATDSNGNAATTIEGSIRVSTQQPDLVHFSDLRVIGPGSGTGLNASAGVQLEHCTFSGWDIAVVSNQGGWVGAHYSTFDTNGVGLKFKTSQFGHSDTGYIYNTFTNNTVAVQIEELVCDRELMFDQSRFSGNGTNVDNQINYPVDLSSATFG